MTTKERVSNKERAARQRAEKEERILGVIGTATSGGATIAEIVRAAALSTSQVFRYLAALRQAERVHIGAWLFNGERWTRVYAAGAGKDAEHPALDDVRDDQVENDMRAETLEQHRRWADSWKPRRADAVWF